METSSQWLQRGKKKSAGATMPKQNAKCKADHKAANHKANYKVNRERVGMIWAREGGHEGAVEHAAFLLSTRERSEPDHVWVEWASTGTISEIPESHISSGLSSRRRRNAGENIDDAPGNPSSRRKTRERRSKRKDTRKSEQSATCNIDSRPGGAHISPNLSSPAPMELEDGADERKSGKEGIGSNRFFTTRNEEADNDFQPRGAHLSLAARIKSEDGANETNDFAAVKKEEADTDVEADDSAYEQTDFVAVKKEEADTDTEVEEEPFNFLCINNEGTNDEESNFNDEKRYKAKETRPFECETAKAVKIVTRCSNANHEMKMYEDNETKKSLGANMHYPSKASSAPLSQPINDSSNDMSRAKEVNGEEAITEGACAAPLQGNPSQPNDQAPIGCPLYFNNITDAMQANGFSKPQGSMSSQPTAHTKKKRKERSIHLKKNKKTLAEASETEKPWEEIEWHKKGRLIESAQRRPMRKRSVPEFFVARPSMSGVGVQDGDEKFLSGIHPLAESAALGCRRCRKELDGGGKIKGMHYGHCPRKGCNDRANEERKSGSRCKMLSSGETRKDEQHEEVSPNENGATDQRLTTDRLAKVEMNRSIVASRCSLSFGPGQCSRDLSFTDTALASISECVKASAQEKELNFTKRIPRKLLWWTEKGSTPRDARLPNFVHQGSSNLISTKRRKYAKPLKC